MTWLPSHIHSIYSVLDGTLQPPKLAKKCKELGYTHCSLTDHGNIAGSVKFYKAMRSEGVIPVLGNEFYVYEKEEDRALKHCVVMAKNLSGWKSLVTLTSISNKKFYYHPRINFQDLVDNYDKNLLIFSGHYGSVIGDSLNPDDVKKHKEAFGDDFYLELQRFLDNDQANQIRKLADQIGVRAIASADAHYLNKEDANIHRIVLCSNIKTTLREVRQKISLGEDFPFSTFFTKSIFYLPSMEELQSFGHSSDEINCSDVLSKIESFDIFTKPKPPKFNTGGITEIEFLKQVCREGWKKKSKDNWNTDLYGDRVKYELSIIEEFDLAGYLLVVWDYIKYAKDRHVFVGAGRGCLTNTEIVCKDEIKDISNIQVGDIVTDKNGKYQKVLEKYEYDVNEELLNIKCFYGDGNGITLTKDHKVLCYKDDLSTEWKEARNLTVDDYIFTPWLKTSSKKINHKGIEVDPAISYLAGVFAGDGWFKGNNILICFGHSKVKQESLETIKRILSEHSISYSCDYNYKDAKANLLTIKSDKYYELFKWLFKNYDNNSINKHVPKQFFEATYDCIQSFVLGLAHSDGTRQGNTARITSISKSLIYDIRKLILKVRTPSSVFTEDRVGKESKGFKHLNKVYYVSFPTNIKKGRRYKITKDGYFSQIRKIENFKYNGKVYDFKVENESNYLTTSGIVHNSSAGSLVCYLMGITEIDPIKYGLMFERFINTSRFYNEHINFEEFDYLSNYRNL